MATPFQALPAESEVTEGRSCNVNHVGTACPEQFRHVAKGMLDLEAIAQLPRHERFKIAGSDNLASRDPANLLKVIVCDLAAANDSDFKHGSRSYDNRQSIVLARLPLRREVSSPEPF